MSIIVNVFNGERYNSECIDSILALIGNWGFKVVIVDDASTDATVELLHRYDDTRIEIVHLPRNVGAAEAINRALGFVRIEVLARIDYDNWYHPNFLVDSIVALKQHHDAAFVCGAARMIDQVYPHITLMAHKYDLKAEPIVIEDDVWIGFGVTVLKGVRIGRGAVVGCDTLVTKDVEPFSVVAGNPMRVIRTVEAVG